MKEPELAAQMAKSAGSIQNTSVYCASCAGNLTRAGGKNIKHLLVQILGREEVPDVRHSLWNRGSCRKIEEGEKYEERNKINGSKR